MDPQFQEIGVRSGSLLGLSELSLGYTPVQGLAYTEQAFVLPLTCSDPLVQELTSIRFCMRIWGRW